MSYIKPENLTELRKIDALSYMLSCEPQELMHDGYNRYRLSSEHSCVISPKGWYAWQRCKGGKSAIDLLCELRGLSLIEACEMVGGASIVQFEYDQPAERGEMKLPPPNFENKRVFNYLCKRGIDEDIIQWCLDNDLIYEEKKYGGCVFVGYDEQRKPKYAFIRGTYSNSRFKQEIQYSQKKYSFRIVNEQNTTLNIFESAIDALSFATLMKNANKDWQSVNYLSLGGLGSRLPPQLLNYLEHVPQTSKINLCLDNDRAGVDASQQLYNELQKDFEVLIHYPRCKDWNDYLCQKERQI